MEQTVHMVSRTPLYEEHCALNAHCVEFAGWEMPMHYGSQIQEHHAVRTHAGIFDVSHMAVIDVAGSEAKDFLRYALANDIAKLKNPGKALYSCLLNQGGGIIDDLICYRMNEHNYRLVVNASRRDYDFKWLKQLASTYPTVNLKLRPDLAMIAVQGPDAISIAQQILFPMGSNSLNNLKPFHFILHDDALIARTGYTGEEGVEIILPATNVVGLWRLFIKAGVVPCGLGARDTLRLEAGLNLYGSDMDETTTPLMSNLGWTISWDDETRDFCGKNALLQEMNRGVQQKLVGLIMRTPGVLRGHQKIIFEDGKEGIITSGTFSPSLGFSIALARIPASANENGKVERRGQYIAVEIVKPPFVKQGKKLY